MRLVSDNAPWLAEGRDLSHSKDPERLLKSIIYFRGLKVRTPRWLTLAQRKKFNAVYRRARKMNRRGLNVHVDHIVPLRHPMVSGLNVWWNLQIIAAPVNMAKSNHWWPECPFENHDLFGGRYSMPEPFQHKLF